MIKALVVVKIYISAGGQIGSQFVWTTQGITELVTKTLALLQILLYIKNKNCVIVGIGVRSLPSSHKVPSSNQSIEHFCDLLSATVDSAFHPYEKMTYIYLTPEKPEIEAAATKGHLDS